MRRAQVRGGVWVGGLRRRQVGAEAGAAVRGFAASPANSARLAFFLGLSLAQPFSLPPPSLLRCAVAEQAVSQLSGLRQPRNAAAAAAAAGGLAFLALNFHATLQVGAAVWCGLWGPAAWNSSLEGAGKGGHAPRATAGCFLPGWVAACAHPIQLARAPPTTTTHTHIYTPPSLPCAAVPGCVGAGADPGDPRPLLLLRRRRAGRPAGRRRGGHHPCKPTRQGRRSAGRCRARQRAAAGRRQQVTPGNEGKGGGVAVALPLQGQGLLQPFANVLTEKMLEPCAL